MKFETTIDIDAAAPRVWSVLADLSKPFWLLAGSLTRRYVTLEATSLKQHCEAHLTHADEVTSS